MRFQIFKRFALREVIGKFIQITKPGVTVLPVGEFLRHHAINLSRSLPAASDFVAYPIGNRTAENGKKASSSRQKMSTNGKTRLEEFSDRGESCANSLVSMPKLVSSGRNRATRGRIFLSPISLPAARASRIALCSRTIEATASSSAATCAISGTTAQALRSFSAKLRPLRLRRLKKHGRFARPHRGTPRLPARRRRAPVTGAAMSQRGKRLDFSERLTLAHGCARDRRTPGRAPPPRQAENPIIAAWARP